MLTDLQEWNRKGWILAPGEERKSFLERIDKLYHFFSHPPPQIDSFLTDGDWNEARARTCLLYDFVPEWVVAHYSDEGLTFFQGAATWIIDKGGVSIPLIQLRKSFEKGNLFKWYRRSEVLSHEAVHAARMEFKEPLFEEIFAYRTSSSGWRQWWGPLFGKPWEAYLFLSLLLGSLGAELFGFILAERFPPFLITLLPWIFVTYLIIRLLISHAILALALRRVAPFLSEKKRSLAVLFRLGDREIIKIACSKKKALHRFFETQKSFRWRLIKETYFL